MSLINQASLVITPNAVKEGKLYSVIPNTTLGDMDVVRATTATRVNSSGLIEVVPRNLLTYSNEFSNANWEKINTTVASGQVGYNGTSNAWLLTSTSIPNPYVRQVLTVNVNDTFSIYLKKGTLNWAFILTSGATTANFDLQNGVVGSLTSCSASIENVGNGWYRCSVTPTTIGTNVRVYPALGNNNTDGLGNIIIQNAQLETSATATEYFPTTTRLNIPRLDYTNGSCPSLLVEPQRTNLLTYSNNFSNITWTKSGCTITPNTTVSPDGNTNASTLTFTAANQFIAQTCLTIGTNVTGSFYLKGTNGQTIQLSVGGLDFLVTLTSNWQRFTLNRAITTAVSININTFGGATARILQIYGFQAEVGSYPTSYIPTVATVTRNADVISKTGISSLIDSQQGVLFADLQFFTGIGNIRSINISNGSNNNRIGFYGHPSVANTITFAISSGGATTDINYNGVILTNRNKVLIRYSGTTFTAFVNGVKSANQTFTPFTANFLNRIGLDYGEDILRYEGRINSIQLYKTALTDTECIALTTL